MVFLVDIRIVHQELLDDNRNSIENEKLNLKENQTSEENKCFMAETSPENSPDATKDELEISPTVIEQGKNVLMVYTQYGPITNVGIFPGLGVLYFCPDFQG